jgi:ATP-dependent DNA helicase RecQ
VISSGFERKNLSYVVRNVDDKFGNMLKVCNGVPGTGIIYVRERKRCEEISSFLRQNGITADFYHAGLSKELRNAKQDAWKNDQIRVIVATNAFGMGIDKPDVRFVVHYDLPDSLEAYFQEAGRAGRDGKRSYATLLWNSTDISRLRQIHTISFPDIQYIKDVYQKVFIYLNIPYEEGRDTVSKFNLIEFSKKFSLNSVSAYYAIKYLEQEGYWELTDEMDNPSKIMFIVGRDELYKVQIDNPELDKFIKSVLRIYTALFSRITPIDEEYIARCTMDSVMGVKEKLKQLSKLRIIKYIPKVRTPLIIMNTERLVESNLYISQKRYEERKGMFQKRIESIISYVKETGECRSRMLIDYFGQPADNDCGICDVCLKNKNLKGGNDRRKEVQQHILDIISNAEGEVELRTIETLAADQSNFYLSVLREMIDDGSVILTGNTIKKV